MWAWFVAETTPSALSRLPDASPYRSQINPKTIAWSFWARFRWYRRWAGGTWERYHYYEEDLKEYEGKWIQNACSQTNNIRTCLWDWFEVENHGRVKKRTENWRTL